MLDVGVSTKPPVPENKSTARCDNVWQAAQEQRGQLDPWRVFAEVPHMVDLVDAQDMGRGGWWCFECHAPDSTGLHPQINRRPTYVRT